MNFSLLAQVDPLDFGRNFRAAEEGFHWANVVLVVLILAGLACGIATIIRQLRLREGETFRSPRQLFLELCQAHGLDRAQRKTLEQLARKKRLQQPARLFVDPELLNGTEAAPLRELIFGGETGKGGIGNCLPPPVSQ
jgi:hypothetical protein